MLKKIIIGFLNTVFRFSVAALVVVLVYRLAMYSYHFGYMVFADASKEPAPGRDIVITAENTEDVLELGRILENRGLIEDRKIFFVQERLSEFHGKMVPGTYTLNTSMKAAEMIEIMAQNYVDPEGEGTEDEASDENSGDKTSGSGDNTVQGYYDPQTGEFIEAEQSAEPTEVQPDEANTDAQEDEPSENDGAVNVSGQSQDGLSAGAGAR